MMNDLLNSVSLLVMNVFALVLNVVLDAFYIYCALGWFAPFIVSSWVGLSYAQCLGISMIIPLMFPTSIVKSEFRESIATSMVARFLMFGVAWVVSLIIL